MTVVFDLTVELVKVSVRQGISFTFLDRKQPTKQ